MHAREPEVLVKDIKRSKFTVSRAECSLVRHRDFGRPSVLHDEGGILLGAPAAFCFGPRRKALGLYVLERISRPVLERCGRLPRRV